MSDESTPQSAPETAPDLPEAAIDAVAESAPESEPAPEAAVEDALAALREQLLREQAEMQNVRRRAEREIDNVRKYALERFATDLLPVMDNMERALESLEQASDEVRPVLEGVELTRRQLDEVFRRFQIEAIDPKDGSFDPQCHEAVASVPAPGVAANTVIQVMQKGYRLNGRVIRAAMVVVAKGENPA